MSMRYLVAGMLLATTSTAAMACPDCVGDYAAWLEDQSAAAGDQEAIKQAYQEYQAQRMAQAKAAFLAKFKSDTTTQTASATRADAAKDAAK